MQTRASTSAPSDGSVRRLVCLNMALHCFTIDPKADDASAKTQTTSLDLKAPDIRRVAPPMLLNASADEAVDIEDQQVQVQGTRPEVYVPGGLASLPWAVMHPTQAWRIFLPVPTGPSEVAASRQTPSASVEEISAPYSLIVARRKSRLKR